MTSTTPIRPAWASIWTGSGPLRHPIQTQTIQGLLFENKPLTELNITFGLGMYRYLETEYEGMSHPASGKQFKEDVLTLLNEGSVNATRREVVDV